VLDNFNEDDEDNDKDNEKTVLDEKTIELMEADREIQEKLCELNL
jgi:hypothetical protein